MTAHKLLLLWEGKSICKIPVECKFVLHLSQDACVECKYVLPENTSTILQCFLLYSKSLKTTEEHQPASKAYSYSTRMNEEHSWGTLPALTITSHFTTTGSIKTMTTIFKTIFNNTKLTVLHSTTDIYGRIAATICCFFLLRRHLTLPDTIRTE